MNIKAYITTELFDKDGKLLWKRRRISKSFLQAFMVILRVQARYSNETNNYKDTDGTDRLIGVLSRFIMTAAAGIVITGIVVGTGTNAVAVTNYALQTLIAHGVTSGKLSYSAQSFSSLTISDPNASFTLWRDMTNSSGGSITVNEEGIYIEGYDTASAVRYFCIIRDKEAAGIAVADGQNLRVTYTIQTST